LNKSINENSGTLSQRRNIIDVLCGLDVVRVTDLDLCNQ